ncbi:tRNA lysidine(34) synthetase TilS [Pseudodesulfovibrio cashew]|uniref:tRNA(Ile)-lysidine synthase n=1 Tax=Pseudodesulfovibrio cashew TaxID=2678688 RepID=A0A6I6JEC2_9BACT|nr:tRNA lysidine(34) synthetase TilS [Pseudodesulfovibrio cashew]QGY41185.1 tRNA lysidine(34) synthetase TilS [Pseudodesulfovibrio cashew]
MVSAPRDIPRTLQDLPPKWAHCCLHVEHFLAGELEFDLSGKTVVVAFSGGVDSTALLLILHYLAQKNGSRVVAAHLNHQLRDEADADAQWTAVFCEGLGIAYEQRTVPVAELAARGGVGLEQAGRDARYAFFADILAQHDAHCCALGHHLDDLCEDVLMRLARGTAWPGLAGMSGYDRERRIIRPLLLTSKSVLQRFLTDIGVTWREDATNADPAMTRNRVRHSLLPLFLMENPNFPETVARLWKVGRLDRDYWDKQTTSSGPLLPHSLLKTSHKALRLRLYKASLDEMDGGQALADTLFKLDSAWEERRFGAVFQFPGDKRATITRDGVVFSVFSSRH